MIFILKASKQVRSRLGFTMVHYYFYLFGGFTGFSGTIVKKNGDGAKPIKEYDYTYPKNGVYLKCYEDRKDVDGWDNMAEKIVEAVD